MRCCVATPTSCRLHRGSCGRDVLVVADRDQAGRDHAVHVASQLDEHARFAWLVEAAAGKDAADHLGARLGITDFAWWS